MNFSILLLFTSLKFLYSYKNLKIICTDNDSSNKFKIEHSVQDNFDGTRYIIKYNNIINNIEQTKNSSFYLPGLLEVFPEFKIDFTKYKLKFKKCVKDDDCENPEICCDNPLKENDKFCCKGTFVGKRTPTYAF